MKKKLLFLSPIVLLLIIGIVVYFSQKKAGVDQEKLNIQLPKITGAVDVKADFSFNLPKDLKLPTKSPLISQEISLDWSFGDVEKIASGSGIAKEPITFNDTMLGKTYLYTEGSVSLTIYPHVKIIRFSQPAQEGGKVPLQDEEYIKIAESFVNKISPKNVYRFAFINYINTGYSSERYSSSNREDSNTVQVNLSPITKDVKIVAKSPDVSLATVTMNKTGTVTKAEIRDVDNIKFSSIEYKLKTLDEIKNSTNNYVLISLDNGYYPDLNQIKGDITNIDISSIELAYLYDYQKKDYLQPVFLIRGTAKMKNVQNEVEVSFYYPAFVQ